MATYEEMKFKILWKLFHKGCWGKHHLAKRDICKGLPRHEVKFCSDVLEDLRKKNIVVRKKHKYGDPYRYYLNRHRYNEIKELLTGGGKS